MELTIKKAKDIKVIPEIFRGEDNPPAFIFRQPNTSDMISIMSTGDISTLLYRCFKGFENKPVIKDENGNETQYTTYQQFIELGLSPELSAIHAECLTKMGDVVQSLSQEAKKVEKKSKSAGKSTKQGN